MFWLKGRCTIGRQSDNDLMIDLPALSRHHALIAASGDRYTLSDLHSRNGTYVNRAPVTRPVPLRDGDEILFGDAAVRYRCTRCFEPTGATVGAAATQRIDQMRERDCWLVLADVAAYAALTERIGSEAALRCMQTWITELRPLIERHGGHINGYLGDAVFAYWLADTPQPDQVLAALRAIETWRPRSPLVFRLVAHHGRVFFTHSDRGEELTGQDVNFIFRIEKIAKSFGAAAMLSEAAVKTLGLGGRCDSYGQSAIDGMSDFYSFFALPGDFTAPAGLK
jgi:class 3 adenylate cyclase